MQLSPHFAELLGAFAAEDVSFLVVGGYAVAFHGHPRATKDIDLWVSGDSGNLQRLSRALARFGAPAEMVREAAALGADDIIYFGQPPVRVDVLVRVEGLDYESSFARAVETSWAGNRVRVIGLDDLLKNKRAVSRDQDLRDVRALERVRAKKRSKK